ncbi:eukaryotic rRNA processing protein EBP2-domain-containing protein [Mycena albidolilacea]|uniref:Eukaryotic rRNA processing protein EBP2-domain-containing protein n=1 Tax=Mycena albidolilacea TaxID=1033008 RepID=A0AAD7F245_9AGAR|nr:eukaryotic rRNA processing protein EBP2-domain-containing protein [Mycena albidolilacea]
MSPSKASKGSKKSASPEKAPKDKSAAAPEPGPSKPTKVAKPIVPAAEADDEEDATLEEDDADSDADSDDDGVDEAGMERLMNALGEDGLDEFEQMQLHVALGGDAGDDNEEDEDTSDEEFTLDKNAEDGASDSGSASDSDVGEDEDEDEGDFEDEEGEEQDVALDDVESVDEDAVPRQKIEIDNTVALARIRETIQLDPSLPWTETLVLTYPNTIDADVDDDLNRELAFYKQALHSATAARALATKHSFPFTRPADYFAEMVKSDAHMERIRQRLLDESAGIKKSDDKRREREGKKFGKQVQIEKLKERERGKKEMEERLKGLKRKRGDMLDKPSVDDGEFDIAVEDALADRPAKRGRSAAGASSRGGRDSSEGGRGRGGARGGRGLSRNSRDQKFGFGGAGKRAKSNTRESTDDFGGGKRGRGGFGGRGGGRGGRGGGGGRGGARGGGGGAGGSKRLGKGRRITARSKT